MELLINCLFVYGIGGTVVVCMCAELNEKGHEVPSIFLAFLLWPLVLGDVIGQHIANSYEERAEEDNEEEDKK